MQLSDTSEEAWKFLMSFLNSSNSPVVITDAACADHPIVFANTAFEKLTGYDRAEVLGKNCRFLQQGDNKQPARDRIAAAIIGGKPCEGVLRNYRKDGTMFWNKLYLFPFSKDGQIMFFVGVQHDVTAERQILDTLKETLAEKAKLNQTLEEKNRRMAKISLELINAQEAERKAVARELHDEFGQRLCALKILLDRSKAYLLRGQAGLLWSRAEMELSELIKLVRQRSASLRPLGLDDFGLEASLHSLLKRQLDGGPIWTFNYSGLPERLLPAIEITVFRIIQESITNVVRHAHANNVEIIVSKAIDGKKIEVKIRDDGTGFEMSQLNESQLNRTRLGLVGMGERVHLLDGDLHVESSLGNGTHITAKLPLRPHTEQSGPDSSADDAFDSKV